MAEKLKIGAELDIDTSKAEKKIKNAFEDAINNNSKITTNSIEKIISETTVKENDKIINSYEAIIQEYNETKEELSKFYNYLINHTDLSIEKLYALRDVVKDIKDSPELSDLYRNIVNIQGIGAGDDLIRDLGKIEGSLNRYIQEIKSVENTNLAGNINLSRAQEKVNEMQQSVKNIDSIQKQIEDRIYSIENGTEKQTLDLDTVRDRLQEIKDIVFSGDYEVSAVDGLIEEFEKLINVEKELTETTQNLKQRAFDMLLSNFKKFGSNVKGVLNHIKKFGANIVGLIKNLQSSAKGFNINLMAILKYAIGIRSLYTLFNRLRSAASDGLNAIAQYSTPLKKSIDTINDSFMQMKASVGAAIAPLVQVLAPVIAQIAQLFVTAANAVARFIAVLTGKKTFTAASLAVSNFGQAAKGAGKATKDAAKDVKQSLAPFDDLQVLAQDTSDALDDLSGAGGGGSGDGFNYKSMFTELPAVSELADLIKKAWKSEDVLHAFEDVGKYIGEYLEKALDKALVEFWPKAQEFAGKIANAIAGTINGFVKVSGLAESIGSTIAAAINTGLTFLSNFWNGVDWNAVGRFLYNGITQAVNDVDWNKLGDYLTGKINGLINLAWSAVGDGGWLQTAITKASEVFHRIVTEVDWQKLGETLHTAIKTLLDGAMNFLNENHDDIVQKFQEFLEGLNIDDIISSLWGLIVEGMSLAFSLAIKFLQDSGLVSAALGLWLTIEFSKLFGGPVATLLQNQLSTGLANTVTTSIQNILAGGMIAGALYTLGVGIVTGIDNAMRENTGFVSGTISTMTYEAVQGANGEIYARGWDGGLTLVQGTQVGIGENGYLVTDEVTGLAYLVTNQVNDSGVEINGIIATHARNGKVLIQDNNAEIVENTDVTTTAIYQAWFTKLNESELTAGEKSVAIQELIAALNKNTKEDTDRALEAMAAKYNLEYSNMETTADTAASNIDSSVETMSNNVDTNTDTAMSNADLNTETAMNNMDTNVEEAMQNISENVDTGMEDAKTAVDTATKDIQTSLDDMTKTTDEKVSAFKKLMEEIAKAVATAASAVASSPIKPIIDTSSIDNGINKLNTFLSLAKSAGSVNVNTSASIKVPHMASGGVLPPNQPFLAMLGDQKSGTNIEAPLDTIVQAMEEALGSMGYSGIGGQEIVLNIDGTTLARMTIPTTMKELNRQGYNVKVLEGK